MTTLPQRWLSIHGICTTLGLNPSQVQHLTRKKHLVRIGDRAINFRYLDPTPEYAERLRLAAVMLAKSGCANIPIDLPLTFLLTCREVAEIMNWGLRHARSYLAEKKIPCYKSKNRAALYSVSAIRNLIWKRNGRKQAGKIAPMLLSEMIGFFRKFQIAEEAIVPTDAMFAEDAALQKKIIWIMKQPQREVLLADFMEKMELAKQVVQTLESA
jgi:hypothetical protein